MNDVLDEEAAVTERVYRHELRPVLGRGETLDQQPATGLAAGAAWPDLGDRQVERVEQDRR